MTGDRLRGFGEKSDAAQVERGVEDIAAAGDDGAAKIWVDEELLRDLPTGPLACRLGAVARRRVDVGAWFLVQGMQVEALGEGVSDFVGVGGEVSRVDQQNAARIGADATHKAIGELGLDDMAQDAIPAWSVKSRSSAGGLQIERGLEIVRG